MNNVEALVEKNPEIRGIRCRFVFSGKNGELTPDFAPRAAGDPERLDPERLGDFDVDTETRGITLAPKKLILTRCASRGVPQSPRWRVGLVCAKDAKLSCRVIFISFASRDGGCFAEAVRVRLQRESPALLTWKDHVSLEGGSKWWDQIQQALDQVRFLVLIVTPCVLHEELAPVVQKELRYARQQGVWIYPVMGSPNDEIPFDKFPRWLEKLTKTTFYDFRPAWPSPWDQPPPGPDYQFTYEWVRFVRQLDAKDRPPCVRNTAPTDLPENYVQRPEFDRLKALLLRTDAEGRREPVSITTSLRGAGGFGKTTLAKALCLDEQIREAFDDGILWVTLGEHPDLRARWPSCTTSSRARLPLSRMPSRPARLSVLGWSSGTS